MQEGSYWGEFLVLEWLISFQESMTELDAGRHLSMGSNSKKKTLHIGWKIYFRNGRGLKTIKASWEGCFIICYCICPISSVIYPVHVLSKLFKHFFPPIFYALCSYKYFLVLKIFLFWSYSPPPSVTQLLFCSNRGAISKVHSYENAWDASFCE